jgi:hypothetical protein
LWEPQSLGDWRSVRLGVKVKVTFRPTVSQSVRLGVKPILGLLTRILSSSEVYFWTLRSCLFWGALSDERSGLSFVSLI